MTLLPVVFVTAALVASLFAVRRCSGRWRVVAWVVAALLALSLGFGVVPGLAHVVFGPVTLNGGKAILVLCLAALLPSPFRFNRRTAALLAAAVVVLPALAMLSGFATWQPAIAMPVLWFAIGNFFSSSAEDFFFRRFVQDHLARFGLAAELLITALLFGLVHIGGGPLFAALAAVAGLLYAAAYRASGSSAWATVAVHWSVNIVRAILFGIP